MDHFQQSPVPLEAVGLDSEAVASLNIGFPEGSEARGDLVLESHDTSTGGPAYASHKEEEEAPTTTSVKTVSCVKLNKHKSKVKQNAIVSH